MMPYYLRDRVVMQCKPCRNSVTMVSVLMQMTVRARDQRLNERVTDATVIINVVRNRFLPSFVSEPYVVGVSENTQVGVSIYQVTAVDSDLTVSALCLL